MKTATEYIRETVDLVRQIETRFLELGKRLYKIHEKGMWSSDYESFQEFLDDARISKGNASMLMAVHKAYIVDHGIEFKKLGNLGYSNLYEAIPMIEKHGVDKAIVMAATLTRQEIKEEVREEEHGECKHTERITICATCHKRVE